MSAESSRWILRPTPRPQARVRLFCFPYAGGGGSMFRTWSAGLPGTVEVCAVQPPGRENRLSEPALPTIPALVERLVETLGPDLDRPFAFFGHSMGSWVAFELTRALQRLGRPGPRVLFASARWAPHWPRRDAPIAHWGATELLAEVQKRYRGIPAELLAHEELRTLFADVLRGDLRALEAYAFEPGPPITAPIVAFWGDRDRPSEESVRAWGELSSGAFEAVEVPGDHFFLGAERELILGRIARALDLVV